VVKSKIKNDLITHTEYQKEPIFVFNYAKLKKIMAKQISENLKEVLNELKIVRSYLENFIKIIPEEGIDEYDNSTEIKKAYQRSLRHSSD